MGMVVYFLISLIFGGGFGLIALIIHEDNDRCHYYHGEWNKGDLTRGCIAVAVCTDESIDELNNKKTEMRKIVNRITKGGAHE